MTTTQETKPSYSPGLEGVIAGESSIARVDPDSSLIYRGYDIRELAELASYEEVLWLLLNGELPDAEQLRDITRQLVTDRTVPSEILAMLRLLPQQTHPMDMLRTGISALAPFDPDLNDYSHDANLRKAIRIVAKISPMLTGGWRVMHGQELYPSRADLTQAANFLFTLTGTTPQPWKAAMFDTVLVLYAEHEFNASTFSARVTASTLSDMYSAVVTALGTLKGPLHGGANEDSMQMLQQIGSPDRVDAWVQEKLAQHEKIMGFGHRVYKSGDARVAVMREMARDLSKRFGQEHWIAICERLEEVMEREKHLYANVDLYAAPVLFLLGVPQDLNTPIFGVARAAGWCAHVIEQHDHNRLIRPRSLYTGPERRGYPTLTAMKKIAA